MTDAQRIIIVASNAGTTSNELNNHLGQMYIYILIGLVILIALWWLGDLLINSIFTYLDNKRVKNIEKHYKDNKC